MACHLERGEESLHFFQRNTGILRYALNDGEPAQRDIHVSYFSYTTLDRLVFGQMKAAGQL
jgi:hypothetical protein